MTKGERDRLKLQDRIFNEMKWVQDIRGVNTTVPVLREFLKM
jgi:hypothetical protein